MSLSKRIFIGLLAGIATGLFFGELTADLKLLGEIFIKLLQMTVLPYIVVSLIAGFGRMSPSQARRLAIRGSVVLVSIWGLALVLIFLAPLAFPSLDTASFFSSQSGPGPAAGNLIELYVPHNIFYSLSNNLVPAVVLFSILLGVALISVEDKSSVLAIFDGLSHALAHINNLVVQLTPLGIFAIAASAAGTMTIDELGRVQVYLVTYISMSMLITFWIFPGLVAAVSGIAYRDVLHTFKDALVTAFATGNQFVVLPLIAENCKTLLARQGLAEEDTCSAIDVIVPVSFNFPSLGKMLVLLFVLFAAWFTNRDISAMENFELAFNGLFSLFGSINIAVPYLLDKLQIPTDMFQLFLVTGVVVGRFGAMLAALHIIVLSVIGTLAVCGRIQITGPSITRYVLISTVSVTLMLGGLRAYFEMFVPSPPQRDEVLAEIEQRSHPAGAQVRDSSPPDAGQPGSIERINQILRRGELRVGYRPRNLPCTYLGEHGQVIGFDADMAQSLAQDLGVALAFIPFKFDTLGQKLSSGELDIAMSCIASLPDRNLYASYSRPYLDLKLSLVVPDHMRTAYSDNKAVRKLDEFSIALISSHYFEPRIKKALPNARIVELESAESFFSGDQAPADALLLSAEEGAAYAYRYPAYTVINPIQPPVHFPAAYALPRGESEWRDLVGNWIDLKTRDGSIDQLYDYWMLGGVTREKQARWSVIRDVLGWID